MGDVTLFRQNFFPSKGFTIPRPIVMAKKRIPTNITEECFNLEAIAGGGGRRAPTLDNYSRAD